MATLTEEEQKAFFEAARDANSFASKYYQRAVSNGDKEQAKTWRWVLLEQYFEKQLRADC